MNTDKRPDETYCEWAERLVSGTGYVATQGNKCVGIGRPNPGESMDDAVSERLAAFNSTVAVHAVVDGKYAGSRGKISG